MPQTVLNAIIICALILAFALIISVYYMLRRIQPDRSAPPLQPRPAASSQRRDIYLNGTALLLGIAIAILLGTGIFAIVQGRSSRSGKDS